MLAVILVLFPVLTPKTIVSVLPKAQPHHVGTCMEAFPSKENMALVNEYNIKTYDTEDNPFENIIMKESVRDTEDIIYLEDDVNDSDEDEENSDKD